MTSCMLCSLLHQDLACKGVLCLGLTASRSVLAFCRYFAHSGKLAATANSLMLHKSLQRRMWHDSARQSQQISKVGRQVADRLNTGGLQSLTALHAADPRRIEAVSQRNYPFGNCTCRHYMSASEHCFCQNGWCAPRRYDVCHASALKES